MKEIIPYGSWKSPITSDLIVAGTINLGQIAIDGEDIYWLEGRPSEGGRQVLVRRTAAGKISEMTPPPFNVRTRVHEYGGGAFLVDNGTIYFVNNADQRLYCQTLDREPYPLTPEIKWHYADLILDRPRNRLICVREDHTVDGEPINTLVSIQLENPEDIQILVQGADFYASPRLSPDHSHLSWISWNHPNLPWDGTELWVAEITAEGLLGEQKLVAGGQEESIFQPEWSPDGTLIFVSDRSNWWNFYQWHPRHTIQSLCPMAAEFGLPQWIFGMSTYAILSPEQLVCTYTQQGQWHLATLNLKHQEFTTLETPYTDISGVKGQGSIAVFLAGSPQETTALIKLDLASHQREVLRRSSELAIDSGYLSVPESIEFPTENGLTAYGLFYPPKNRDYLAPDGEKPPLLVKSHGGPTAATSSTLNLRIQYWTSRGFAVFDVNYGGSTGYGREYRERLKESWGIVDVDDCTNGAKYLAEKELVDPERMMISGGSAGGYTTLCALIFRNVFKAGASYYGVSDIEALVKDSHKFEARYFDKLVAPYPEKKEIYHQRSPIYFTDRLSCPVIFFQGLEDQVVLPNQAERMVTALKAKDLPVAYLLFEGEQHGFRRAENIKKVLDGEFYFYSRIFRFQPADEIEAIPIYNLKD